MASEDQSRFLKKMGTKKLRLPRPVRTAGHDSELLENDSADPEKQSLLCRQPGYDLPMGSGDELRGGVGTESGENDNQRFMKYEL